MSLKNYVLACIRFLVSKAYESWKCIKVLVSYTCKLKLKSFLYEIFDPLNFWVFKLEHTSIIQIMSRHFLILQLLRFC